MDDEKKPFTYAADLYLKVTSALGDLTDALLEGTVTKEHLEKWRDEIEPKLGEMKLELVGAYIISGSATNDFFEAVTKELKNY